MALNHGYEYREQVDGRWAGESVLEYLARRYRHSSREEWKERIGGGEVSLDGVEAGADDLLRPGQMLAWRRPPWDEPDVPLTYALLYRDGDLLAVAKPCGLPTVPAGGFFDHTLLALVRKGHPEATPVHRLGRGTSGVVLFARTAGARSALCDAMRRHEVVKVYRALACGAPTLSHFSIDAPIGPVPHPRLGTVHAASPGGRPALSRVRTLQCRPEGSLLEVTIETGKPHQIRIHLASAGHPLVGDPLYTAGGRIKETAAALPGDCGYLLHAERIELRHPATGSLIEIRCSPPPELRLRPA